MIDVKTEITPPETADDDGPSRSLRVSATIIDVDDISYDAAVQVFDDDCANPDMIALALVRIAMALGMLYSADVSWAVQQRVNTDDGSQ